MASQQITEEQRKQLEEKLKNMSPEELKELQKQQCVFCQIISGKIPSKKVYEDELCIAVLDINPAAKGHLLIIPKEHYAIMPQVPEDQLGHLFLISRHLSQILLKALRSDGTNVFIANGPAAGQRAQHFMVHLIPRKEADGILEIEEKLIDHEMIRKIRSAVEGKLQEILGIKAEKKTEKKIEAAEGITVKEAASADENKELHEKKEPQHLITSATAKRFHKEKCPFAQNIPDESKIIMDEQEAFGSEKKPCSCVTGKKIPLKTDEKQSETKGVQKDRKKDEEKNKLKEDEEKNEEVSLDDIADLFK